MGKWRYQGFDGEGKRVSGDVQANSRQEVRKVLRNKGVRVKRIMAPSFLELDLAEFMVDKGLASPYGTVELAAFTKQFSIMVNAGIPLIQSLEILARSQKNPILKKEIRTIARDVGEGKTLAESMSEQKGFNRLYCNLVKAGEAGGILDVILDKLAEHMEKQEKTKRQVKGAMSYPLVVATVGALVVWGLLVFVVPKFAEMISSSGQEIPGITKIVMAASDFLRAHILLTLGIIAGLGVFLRSYIKTPKGKEVFDGLVVRVPVFGGIILKGSLASFTRTLSTMLGAGVSLVESLEICIDTVDNEKISKDLSKVREDVIQGSSLTEPLLEIDYFPEMVGQMMKIGEQTGQVDSMLAKIADVFEDEVSTLITTMTKMMEPIIIVVLGGIIGALTVAIYLPIFMQAGGTN